MVVIDGFNLTTFLYGNVRFVKNIVMGYIETIVFVWLCLVASPKLYLS